MRVFFLSTNQNMAESLRRTLGRSNIDVVHARSFEQARRLLSSPPDIFFADYYIHTEQSIPFIKKLQKDSLLLGSDIWLTGYNLTSSEQKKSLEQVLGSRYWSQPLPYLDIQDHLVSKDTEQTIILSSASVRLVGQIWASRGHAILNGDASRIIFSDGALIREDPPDCLLELLEEDFLQYSAIQSISGGDWLETGNKLLSLCMDADTQEWEKEHRKSAFGFQVSIAFEGLDISKKTQSFISSRSSIFQARLPQESIPELYALWMLGVIKPETAVERSRTQRADNFQSRVQQKQDYAWVCGEFERLKSADPFTVLGVHKKTEDKVVLEAVKRMSERYESILTNSRISDEVRLAAKNMLDLIKRAAANVNADEDLKDLPEEQRLLIYAKRMVEQGNWTQAEKALKKAHQIRIEDIDILAYLGWVQYNVDKSQEGEALESLQLALHLDSSHLDTLVFLSKIYVAKEEYESAIVFLRKATKLTPDPEIQELRALVEAEIKILERNRKDDG
ncbi:MAG: hypothetical protein CL916_02285 [Deltaproteobacteria bacterium]|nr:hypothetical protein [Deltaproteobacteria bacterium]